MVNNGKLTTGPGNVSVKLGEQVVIQVVSDAPDELHIHGYDVETQVAPGATAQVSFTVTLLGIFDVELHESGLKLCEMRVQ